MGPENETNGQTESKRPEREKEKGWNRKGKERKEKSKLTVLQITSAVIKGSFHQGNQRSSHVAAAPSQGPCYVTSLAKQVTLLL